jgi:hypothetical protein
MDYDKPISTSRTPPDHLPARPAFVVFGVDRFTTIPAAEVEFSQPPISPPPAPATPQSLVLHGEVFKIISHSGYPEPTLTALITAILHFT